MSESFRHPEDLIDLATYVGKYRSALVKEGVPDALADQLVRDWHDRVLGPQDQPHRAAARLADVESLATTAANRTRMR